MGVQGFVKARTAQANHIRSLLTEFVVSEGIAYLPTRVPALLEPATDCQCLYGS